MVVALPWSLYCLPKAGLGRRLSVCGYVCELVSVSNLKRVCDDDIVLHSKSSLNLTVVLSVRLWFFKSDFGSLSQTVVLSVKLWISQSVFGIILLRICEFDCGSVSLLCWWV